MNKHFLMNFSEYLQKGEFKALLWAKRHIVGALLLSFIAGVLTSGLWGAFERYELNKMKRLLELSELQQRQLLNQSAELTLTSERLRATNQALTEAISEQELENRELHRGLDFYRQLMDPQKVQDGLVLQRHSIDPVENNIYRLRFTFVQYALKRALMRAQLSFSLKGKQDGKDKQINFTQLSPQEANNNRKLSFKYFQEIEQLIEVPENFQVESIEINATLRRTKNKYWQQSLPWINETSTIPNTAQADTKPAQP